MYALSSYCKFENFCENFNFANSVKRHTFDQSISRLGYDSPISVVESVILSFCEDYVFTKLRENKILAKISEFKVTCLARVLIMAMQQIFSLVMLTI